MNIVLTNQHCDNRGDESAVVGLVKSIYEYFGRETKITLLKQTKGYRFLTENVGVEELEMFNSYGTVFQLMLWLLFKLIHINIKPILSKGMKQILSLHENADMVFSSCGGPYIGDLYVNHEIIHIFYAMIPLVMKKKLVFTAPSMGPFRIKIMNPFRRYILNRASLIVLRDNVSYRFVNEFLDDQSNIFLTADACFAHDLQEDKKELFERKNMIGVTPLKYAFKNAEDPEREQEKYEQSVISVLDQHMSEDKELGVEFFPQLYNKHSDLPLIQNFIKRLKFPERATIFSEQKSGVEQQKEIANMKLMIATRYHSAVFACKMNVPCVCIAYEHKAVGMMDLYGLGKCVLNIYNVTPELLSEKVDYVTANTEQIFEILQTRNPKILSLAQRTIGLSKKVYENKPLQKTEPVVFFDEIIKSRFLCKNCGMCEAVCPTASIVYEQNKYMEYMPKLREVTCINCKKCIDACCARSIPASGQNPIFGNKSAIYLAKAVEETTHTDGSSGGVISALTKFGLQHGYFNELLTVGYTENPRVAQPVVISDPEHLTAGSKYISTPLCSRFTNEAVNLAATALPCQATAIKKQNEDTFVFGIFCSKLTTEKLLEFMTRKSGVKMNDIERMEYRSGVWPGYFIMSIKDGRKIKYSLNRSFFTAVYNSFLFANEGCLLCSDYFCEDADISFGDPWGKPQYQEGYFGETVVIVRNERAQKLFDDAISADFITAVPMDDEDVIKGHMREIYIKKIAIKNRLKNAQKLSGEMFNVDPNALIPGKISNSGNRFMEYNNRTIKNKYLYKMLSKIPNKVLFAYRYANVYFLSRFLKRNQYFKYLCKINQEANHNG